MKKRRSRKPVTTVKPLRTLEFLNAAQVQLMALVRQDKGLPADFGLELAGGCIIPAPPIDGMGAHRAWCIHVYALPVSRVVQVSEEPPPLLHTAIVMPVPAERSSADDVAAQLLLHHHAGQLWNGVVSSEPPPVEVDDLPAGLAGVLNVRMQGDQSTDGPS